ncbi:hypothetical protein [Micromonospora sp. ATCC 39149]|nr:hypothetical protein [Micromonospora sp. ATCC 39149]
MGTDELHPDAAPPRHGARIEPPSSARRTAWPRLNITPTEHIAL